MAPVSPVVSRWEITFRVKQRREELGISGAMIAKSLGFTATYWSKLENDQRVLPEDRFRALVEYLEFDKKEQAELLKLRDAAVRNGWWDNYSSIFNPSELRLWGLEHGADHIRSYESLLIPGLLQTEDYARSLITADRVAIRGKEADRRVAVRLRRQERVFGDDPVRLEVVISQAALEQQFGGPRVLREQLERLVSVLTENPESVEVRVIPFTSRIGPIFGGAAFHLLDFPRPMLATLAWHESPVVSGVIEAAEPVFDLASSFEYAKEQAYSAADSLELIKESAAKLEHDDR